MNRETSKMKLDEETALAVLLTNLKGRKKKDYLATAQSSRFLKQKYGSCEKVAKKVGVSSEIIREFDSLVDLPQKVKRLIATRAIKLDTGYRISTQIEGGDRQTEIAKEVANLGAFDARAIIEYARKNRHLSAEECKRRVLGSKTVTERLHVFVLSLPEATFQELKLQSQKLKTSLEELAAKIIEDWLQQRAVKPR